MYLKKVTIIINTLFKENIAPLYVESFHQFGITVYLQTCFSDSYITDNTNVEKRMLYNYVSKAHNARYCVVLVEPRTSWKYSVSDCALKNHHNVTEDILQEQLSKFQQINALYYGWFPSEENSRTLKDSMLRMFSDCLAKIPSFKDYLVNDNQEDERGKLIFDFVQYYTFVP